MAQLAAVSEGTVDRIIHNRGQVTQENIDKVNAIIKEYGYKKNIFASNLAFNKKFKFAVFLPKNEGLEYWEIPINGIERAEDEFEKFGVTLDYYFYKYNSNSFKKIASKLLEQKYDGILFAPIFHDESILFLNQCKKKNIPVVMIDSNIKEVDSFAYIGQDAFQSGYLAGRLVCYNSTLENNVLIIKITREIESTSVYLQRIKGFYSFFEDHKEFANFKFSEIRLKDSGQKQLNVKMFEGINTIFIPNSRSYIVAKFLNKNKLNHIKLVGYDLLQENVKYLKDGVIDFLINQKPEQQGYLGVEYLYKKIILKENVENTYYMPLEIIIKENFSNSHENI
ncbi:substrate-binding domain-containing protein [Flavobacterium gawalongense]|uniref:Substrate-binding domain-containing protein n=1 Tax=Flavobacterium gawalongense TaxID=2594432 RepID=A0A553BAN0_9FLAO|nr:substrate-binding domain-containing protein [Flavobacterium gawalongense]TRX03770.1 substrate-binding domain-containing protein [Flavobacterium gawalongense]TRX05302.1 substrate-binding domain-containing protein [Flavobacterium gawalongense]TRX08553.1 substrate-binding domain-containing protein [Flavobacterium gawalongense]TRX08918.1 substrate-binding domain-containing protein [Flavobacterium gawalongense]TRX24881.1 substrate-binding domain-containing protein [Flavobacterium gawalongense]